MRFHGDLILGVDEMCVSLKHVEHGDQKCLCKKISSFHIAHWYRVQSWLLGLDSF